MIIHPLFVHFPIALLSLYAFMEIVSPFIFQHEWWRTTKRFLIITGWFAVIPAIIAGDEALDIIGEFPLSELHEHAALITATLFFSSPLFLRISSSCSLIRAGETRLPA